MPLLSVTQIQYLFTYVLGYDVILALSVTSIANKARCTKCEFSATGGTDIYWNIIEDMHVGNP
jgi:hypothetical protein